MPSGFLDEDTLDYGEDLDVSFYTRVRNPSRVSALGGQDLHSRLLCVCVCVCVLKFMIFN